MKSVKFALVILSFAFLTACGAKKAETTTQDSTATAAPVATPTETPAAVDTTKTTPADTTKK